MAGGALTTFISSSTPGAGQAPKYVTFESDCVVYVVSTPEPSTLLGAGLAAAFGLGILRRRVKSA